MTVQMEVNEVNLRKLAPLILDKFPKEIDKLSDEEMIVKCLLKTTFATKQIVVVK